MSIRDSADLLRIRETVTRELSRSHYLFDNIDQQITSKNTDTPSHLENDNTCGVEAFRDIHFPDGIYLLVDVGGGKSDNVKEELMSRYHFQVEVIDPFNRSFEHNLYVQSLIRDRGGACMVTSMSVLNVIPDTVNRMRHICLAHHILKKHGYACFKIWKDPDAETEVNDSVRNTFQANKKINEYMQEIQCVFGEKRVFLNTDKNLITAIKM